MCSDKKNLLYISPTIPAPGGNGRAMRAYHMIRFLARFHHIHLLIISREVKRNKNCHISGKVSSFCQSVKCVPVDPRRDINLFIRVRLFKISRRLYYRFYGSMENLYCSPGLIKTIQSLYRDIEFSVIHVSRIYMTGFAGQFLTSAANPELQLDLDDIESRTHFRLSEIYAQRHQKKDAEKMQLDAVAYQKLEQRVLKRAKRVFVCSTQDKRLLSAEYSITGIHVVPNIVDLPGSVSRPGTNDRFVFLFLGTFGYFPNYDGILHFCKKILPILRKRAERPFEVHIAGTGISMDLAGRLRSFPEVHVIGMVSDVRPQYAAADAVIIPLRAGGGTRIKVLEAFAHQCPVVSTELGVEGIDGQPGEHFLTSNSDHGFAVNCLNLMDEPGLSRRLADNALELVKDKYVFTSLPNKLGDEYKDE